MSLHTYLPQDRLRALAHGNALPDRTTGSALFADISGFTALTESLRETLGARQGAEELTRRLGAVYSALIAEVEKHNGSVIGFAGDSMLCWFDERVMTADGRAQTDSVSRRSPAARALRAGVGMQVVIQEFPEVGLKVAITSGDARRFVVGDPEIQKLDALAGATVARASTGEHQANQGDVVLDEVTANALGSAVVVKEWRNDEGGEQFGVVEKLSVIRDTSTSPSANQLSVQADMDDRNRITAEQLRPWIHASMYTREASGQGAFLTEFRPCMAVFVRFMGIDFDADSAEAELDAFIRQVQSVAARYSGTLMDITIGDKGSYAYINFGALAAHEDDARRAVKAALELRNKTELQLQMGVTQGVMRVGAYGGVTRKTFGALGDDVNLAARLMMNAAVGEILLTSRVHKATAEEFLFEPRAALTVKGKTEPVTVFALIGEQRQRAIRLQEPQYALPMVGRVEELKRIEEKLGLAAEGNRQVIGIVAEAGLGKSRLVAEVIRAARKKGFVGYGGTCQSDSIHTPYQAWKSIWGAFFDVDHEQPLRQIIRYLEDEIEVRAPSRVDAMPLLNVVLDLEIPDNDFTTTLEPKYRKSTLRALLEDCLLVAAQDDPLLIVIEDLHWIDALSHDLLEELARDLSDSRICFVLAYRPPQLARLEAPRLEALAQFTKIELDELTQAEATLAIRAKLAQLYPARGGALPSGLVDKLMARAQGNPFYLEELLNYVRDRGLDPSDIVNIELPDSLHALILSRIDQLSEREKTTLYVASIVGRLFRAEWLTGYYPDLGGMNRVKSDLEQLAEMDITPLDSPEPELAYLFKHIVTHEVTYESLPFATRAKLHEQLAKYLERVDAAVDTIAFHYGRSDNTAKKREYYQKAADAAQVVSAFATAVEYLTRLLDVTPKSDPTRCALALKLADAHYFQSDYSAARAAIGQAQAAATTDTDRAAALALLGEMTSQMGDYTEAQTILAEAVPLARASGDRLTLCRALSALGVVNRALGKLDDAKVAQEESLALARALGDLTRELFALLRLGVVVRQQGDLAEAERLHTEVHTRAVAAGNRERAMMALNNLGVVAGYRKESAAAKEYYQQALALAREVGAQQSIALLFTNLGGLDIELGQFTTAREKLREGLALALRLGALPWVVAAVANFAFLAHAEGQAERALALLGLARHHPAWSGEDQRQMDRWLTDWALDPSVVEAGMKKGEALDWEETVRELLKG